MKSVCRAVGLVTAPGSRRLAAAGVVVAGCSLWFALAGSQTTAPAQVFTTAPSTLRILDADSSGMPQTSAAVRLNSSGRSAPTRPTPARAQEPAGRTGKPVQTTELRISSSPEPIPVVAPLAGDATPDNTLRVAGGRYRDLLPLRKPARQPPEENHSRADTAAGSDRAVQVAFHEADSQGRGAEPRRQDFPAAPLLASPLVVPAAAAPQVPDPEAQKRRQAQYEVLEKVLAELFPDSQVKLIRVADKPIVRGQARDAEKPVTTTVIILVTPE